MHENLEISLMQAKIKIVSHDLKKNRFKAWVTWQTTRIFFD